MTESFNQAPLLADELRGVLQSSHEDSWCGKLAQVLDALGVLASQLGSGA